MQLSLPEPVQRLIALLEQDGHEAYIVGGCVRDSLRGLAPADWDLCTSARPEETTGCLERAGIKVVPTGVAHGTVTAVLEGQPYEITTFRTEDAYSDHRRPDSVTFVKDLEQDLARRDFTVNAMAYRPCDGLADPFGGLADLEAGLIRCVGDPDLRLSEDALRILRAARFASTTGFAVEELTRRAVLAHAGELLRVAPERLCTELLKLLCGINVVQALRDYAALIFVLIPELAITDGYAQNTPHHCYDVWEHTIRAVGEVPPDPLLRLTMLLHDVAKPLCHTTDRRGTDHFKGHPRAGAEMAGPILRRLRLDNATRERAVILIRHHDSRTPARTGAVRRMLAQVGEEVLRQLLPVQRADTRAQSDYRRAEKLARIDGVEACLEQILDQGQAFRLPDLAVDGNDLMAAVGIPAGPAVGDALNYLLDEVLDDRLPNRREPLLQAAQKLWSDYLEETT